MLFMRLITLAIVTLPLANPALGSTSDIVLSNANLPDAILRFSCDEQDKGISVDLDNPPAAFVEQDAIVGVFDVETPRAFALNGFSVSIDETHTRLVLDPRYPTAVEDGLTLLAGAGNHTLTVLAPKGSLMVSWPLGKQAIEAATARYRSTCK